LNLNQQSFAAGLLMFIETYSLILALPDVNARIYVSALSHQAGAKFCCQHITDTSLQSIPFRGIMEEQHQLRTILAVQTAKLF